LARRDSPHRGGRHLGLAKALVEEMPHTLAALTAGHISEWRATLLVRETAGLSRADRSRVDAELAAARGGLAALGDGAAAAAARRIAYGLDPHGFTARAAKAAADRTVTLRPAPDTMSYLTGLLPVPQGVAVHTALVRHADSLRAGGDDRSRGQIMADTLVERVTGQAAAAAVPVEIQLVMTDHALLDPDQDEHVETGADAGAATGPDASAAGPRRTAPSRVPALVPGYGPVPAPLARQWLLDVDAPRWLRRLFTRPSDGALVAMESTARTFAGRLRQFVAIRDQERCRTPWCDARLRHVDHAERAADGGRTSAINGQRLCEARNYAKDAPGWRARAVWDDGDGHLVETVTPTGHAYLSHAPRPPSGPPGESATADTETVPAPAPSPAPARPLRLDVYFRDGTLVA
jgi:hypothetical protein